MVSEDSTKTMWSVLTELRSSGCRYRIRAGEHAWFSDELLVSLLETDAGRAVLDRRCELRDEIDAQRCTTVWQIWYISEEDVPPENRIYQTCRLCGSQHLAREKQTKYEQSPYVLEDLLDLYRVGDWLEQQPADRIVATCRNAGENYSATFVEQYYRDIIATAPPSLFTGIKRPHWLIYLDGLMSGLLAQDQSQEVQLRAETLLTWLGCIQAIHDYSEEQDLNAEEEPL